MSNKPTHKLVLRENYKTNDGENKVKWHQVMALWETEKWWLVINLPKGMTLSWTLYIFKNEEQEQSNGWANAIEDDWLPF